MSTGTTADLLGAALRRDLTVDDLPDERGCELIDGSLYVSPPGDFEHQDLCATYLVALRADLGHGLTALAGVNVVEGGRTLVEPDVAVVDRGRMVHSGLGVSPQGLLFVVEVTTPSTRRRGLTVKRDLYAEWGVPYLVVDRATVPHTLHVFDVPGVPSPYPAMIAEVS